jgi:hypothetical protein
MELRDGDGRPHASRSWLAPSSRRPGSSAMMFMATSGCGMLRARSRETRGEGPLHMAAADAARGRGRGEGTKYHVRLLANKPIRAQPR